MHDRTYECARASLSQEANKFISNVHQEHRFSNISYSENNCRYPKGVEGAENTLISFPL